MFNKVEILNAVISQLEAQLAELTEWANKQRAEATHSELKAENKYDTRAIEAGYLASGQARRAQRLEAEISSLRRLHLKEFKSQDVVSIGALVEVELGGEEKLFFILPGGGGLKVCVGQSEIQVLTPVSPLGEALLGLKLFDEVEVELQGVIKSLELLGIE